MDRWWRIVRTGFSFALFGVGSLILGLLVAPVAAVLPGGAERRELRIQKIIHQLFRLFAGVMRGLGLIRVSVRAPERLHANTPCLVIANHPTLIDIVLLVARMPQADCVVKKAHWSNPFTRGVMRGAGYLPNEGGEATIEACARRLRAGRSVVLFPEGTRSPRGGVGKLQRGAAHIALAARAPALPVTISCDPPGLMRGQPWYEVADRALDFVLEVGEPIAPEPAGQPRAQASRALTATYREHFEKALERADG